MGINKVTLFTLWSHRGSFSLLVYLLANPQRGQSKRCSEPAAEHEMEVISKCSGNMAVNIDNAGRYYLLVGFIYI
jgi:hypothetical protein